jgi:Holliday junction resolvase RusA-like endonuclease
MNTQTYKIKMAPFPKARPRVTKKGTFMPKKYVAKREKLQWLFKEAGGELNIEGIVSLTVAMRFKMPKAWSITIKDKMDGQPCGKKPDIDNCIGAVMDALFAEDSKVTEISASKTWGYQDAIYIMIQREEDWLIAGG